MTFPLPPSCSAPAWRSDRESIANSVGLPLTSPAIHEAEPQEATLVLMPFVMAMTGFTATFVRKIHGELDCIPHRIDEDDYAGDAPLHSPLLLGARSTQSSSMDQAGMQRHGRTRASACFSHRPVPDCP